LHLISVKFDARLNLDITRSKNKSMVIAAIIRERQEVCKSICRLTISPRPCRFGKERF